MLRISQYKLRELIQFLLRLFCGLQGYLTLSKVLQRITPVFRLFLHLAGVLVTLLDSCLIGLRLMIDCVDLHPPCTIWQERVVFYLFIVQIIVFYTAVFIHLVNWTTFRIALKFTLFIPIYFPHIWLLLQRSRANLYLRLTTANCLSWWSAQVTAMRPLTLDGSQIDSIIVCIRLKWNHVRTLSIQTLDSNLESIL